MTTPTRPAMRTVIRCTIIASLPRRMIHWALVVGFKPFSSSRFCTRNYPLPSETEENEKQQTSNTNRLKIERNTRQAMADGKTRTET